jgi:hypothetical protein
MQGYGSSAKHALRGVLRAKCEEREAEDELDNEVVHAKDVTITQWGSVTRT